MNIWQFIRPYLERYGGRTAFFDTAMTYSRLIEEVEARAAEYKHKNRMITVCGNKTEQAVDILAVLCSGNTAVPVSTEYGADYAARVQRLMRNAQAAPDTAICAFSSGTTGTPKGILLSHDAIIADMLAVSRCFKLVQGDRMLIVRPLCHMSAITAELLCALYAGIEIAFYDSGFNPTKLIQTLREKNITVLCTTPTVMYHCARRHPDGLRLRAVCLSGEILSPGRAEFLAAGFPQTDFYNAYGLSEHSPRVSMLGPEDFIRKAGSVGKPIPGVRVRIDGTNELVVSSPCIMQGYYNMPEATDKALRGGELYTGDIAHTDSEGYLYIDGRKDGMIIRGGVNIMPQELREVLLNMPGVEDCTVWGKEDENFGQRIAANVYGTVTPSEVRAYAAACLPAYMVPSDITVSAEPAVGGGGKLRTGDAEMGRLYSIYKEETFEQHTADNI